MASSALRIRVFGATSAAGGFLLPLILGCGHSLLASSRERAASGNTALNWLTESLPDASPLAPDTTHALSLGPLDLFVMWLARQSAGGALRQVIALGSTSASTKADSASAGERELAQRLRQAEVALAGECARLGARWTLLRPTLIYGGAADLVARIGAIAARWHVFPHPLGRAGGALRQPVHAADLAAAACAAIDNPAAHDRAFDLGGGEALSLASLCRRAAHARTRFALPLPLPVRLLVRASAALGLLPAGSALNAESASRMARDQLCDHAAAQVALGYSPRAFTPGSK